MRWFRILMAVLFVPIMLGAIVISGQHTYEVLVGTTGTTWWIALGAAVVIDAAIVYLGTQTAYMATQGDDITQIQVATWFLILVSVGVNFLHGYMSGGFVGGPVAMIYPVVAALIYHFFIADKIRNSLRERGRILPEKPLYARSLNKATRRELDKQWADLTGLQAADNLAYIEATTVGTWRQAQPTSLQAEATVPTADTYKPTTYDYSLPTADTDVALQLDTAPTPQATSLQVEPTDVGSVVSQVETILEGVDTSVDTPDYLDTSMSVQEMCSLLVANGVVDNTTAYGYINALLAYEVPKKTVQTSMKRARDKISA